LPDSGRFVLIAALSGRALAAAARRAGYQPLVADLFADLDTQEIAAASLRVSGSLAQGLRRRPLLDALDRLAAGRAVGGLVYGSGFERRPTLLRDFARHYKLLGNSAGTVIKLTDPAGFAAMCDRLDVPHPEIQQSAAPAGDWLEKRIGGAGGGHVRPAQPGKPPGRGRYLQRRIEGRPASALFLADGQNCHVLGFSEQWADPAPGQPFRYCGAVRPACIDPAQATAIAGAIARLVPEIGVVGLNSADFLLRDDGFDLLEINPRPGATLDIYADAEGKLFDLHVQACRGRMPSRAPEFGRAAAAMIVYVPRACTLPQTFDWPEWAADRQPAGIAVEADGPLCTVRAEADDAETARAHVRQRAAAVLKLAGMGQ
jgi:predicted ATP-grasp superfamily ATP-dependent carboligase